MPRSTREVLRMFEALLALHPVLGAPGCAYIRTRPSHCIRGEHGSSSTPLLSLIGFRPTIPPCSPVLLQAPKLALYVDAHVPISPSSCLCRPLVIVAVESVRPRATVRSLQDPSMSCRHFMMSHRAGLQCGHKARVAYRSRPFGFVISPPTLG